MIFYVVEFIDEIFLISTGITAALGCLTYLLFSFPKDKI